MNSFQLSTMEGVKLLKSFTSISFADNPYELFYIFCLLVFSTSVWTYICKSPGSSGLNKDGMREPPLLSYYIPYVGSAISFAFNPRGFYNRVV